MSNMESLRDSIVEELGCLQVYSPCRFFGTILPQITDYELSQVKAELKIDNTTSWITEEMGKINPGKSQQHETAAFAGISTVFNKVARAVTELHLGVPRIRCQDCPTQSPEVETGPKTKPDACFVLNQTQLPPNCDAEVDRLHWKRKHEKPPGISWADIAGTMEYMKVSNDQNAIDNARKSIFNMCQIMAVDPCRKAVFSFTYEDRLFDDLLKFWVALCISGMEKLGYDTSIRRVEIDGKERFRIKVNGYDAQNRPIVEEYLTLRWLSNFSANRIVGRATRVWEVVEIDPETQQAVGESKVLKDSWVDHDRTLEGARYRAINKWFHENPKEAKLSLHFLTFHGDSVLKHENIRESTFDSLRGGMRQISEAERAADFKSNVGPVDQLNQYVKEIRPLPIVNRVHYRLLVNEVCRRIDEAGNFALILGGIIGANSALQALQKMGIVHGDISTGNILLDEKARVGKLGDLEFCMEYDRVSSEVHQELTGTPFFMSDEVLSGAYSWQPPELVECPKLELSEPEFDATKLFGGGESPPLQPTPSVTVDPFLPPTEFVYPFIQNYIHDAESIWWILSWFLLATHPSNELDIAPEVLEKRKEKLKQFFPEFSAARKNAKENPFFNLALLRYKEVPTAYQDLYTFLVKELRNFLTSTYRSAESLPDRFQREPMDGVHQEMSILLRKLGHVALCMPRGGIEFADYVHCNVQVPSVSQEQKSSSES